MSIETYGTGDRLRVAARMSVPFGIERRIVLLPVPSTRDGKNVASTEIPLSEVFSDADERTYILGYGIPQCFSAAASASGAVVHDLSLDEDYLLENAELTAIGCLGYILTTTKSVPGDVSFGIVGYGRIGRAVSKLLLFLGARVSIFTTRDSVRRELGGIGIGARLMESPLDLSDIDILINTAPRDMSGEFSHGLPLGMRVIELASGENFKGIPGLERLPGLPEKYYSESAGRTYAAAVKRVIMEDLG